MGYRLRKATRTRKDGKTIVIDSKLAPRDFALIVGAMKSGTTSLFELLAQHPRIAASRVKEPDYFSSEESMARGWDWYLSLWNWNPKRHLVALEASTIYSKHPSYPGVAERISRVSDASFKFIYILRNPMQQIASHVRHAQFVGWERELHNGIPEYMIDLVKYAMQIDEYMRFFPRDAMHILALDDLVADAATTLGRVSAFLGVSDDFDFSGRNERYNAGTLYQSSGLVRAFANSRLASAIKPLVPKVVWCRGRQWAANLRRSGSSRRFELTESHQSQIRTALTQDYKRLRAFYGVDTERLWGL